MSPFGLGRPDRRPPGVAGFSQYDKLYADVELWLARGWLDYLAPQLYWPIDSAVQPFGPLLDYWLAANTTGRHVWPGLFTSRINDTPQSWRPAQIADQVALARSRRAGGHIHFSMAALMQDRQGITGVLKATYPMAALVPATHWLPGEAPAVPDAQARLTSDGASVGIDFTASPGVLAIWARYGERWVFSVAPAAAGTARVDARLDRKPLEALVVSAVSRIGLEGGRRRVLVPAMGMK